jgi:hypothetical protein
MKTIKNKSDIEMKQRQTVAVIIAWTLFVIIPSIGAVACKSWVMAIIPAIVILGLTRATINLIKL